jgi:hypothetical protein
LFQARRCHEKGAAYYKTHDETDAAEQQGQQIGFQNPHFTVFDRRCPKSLKGSAQRQN